MPFIGKPQKKYFFLVAVPFKEGDGGGVKGFSLSKTSILFILIFI